jgi:hypothetical protein
MEPNFIVASNTHDGARAILAKQTKTCPKSLVSIVVAILICQPTINFPKSLSGMFRDPDEPDAGKLMEWSAAFIRQGSRAKRTLSETSCPLDPGAL